jgi:hypothetical protein
MKRGELLLPALFFQALCFCHKFIYALQRLTFLRNCKRPKILRSCQKPDVGNKKTKAEREPGFHFRHEPPRLLELKDGYGCAAELWSGVLVEPGEPMPIERRSCGARLFDSLRGTRIYRANFLNAMAIVFDQ